MSVANLTRRRTPGRYGYLLLPGTSGNYADTPDSAALSITGDMDIRIKLAMNDWTPGATVYVLAKYLTTGNQKSWFMSISGAGLLGLLWSADGSAAISKVSTSANTISDGTDKWIRATLDVDNGASGNNVKFYVSDDGSAWTQLGTTVTTAGTTSIYNGTAALNVGGYDAGNTPPAAKVYRVQVRNNINDDGTGIVFDADFTNTGRSFVEPANGAIVTLHGTARASVHP